MLFSRPGPGPEPAVNVREAKQAVIDTLSAFVGESPRFEKAIREITKSLEPVRWLDDSHLESRHGHKVFSREYHAVKELLRLLKNSHGLTVSAAARSAASVAIDDLVEVDRLLAQIRLDDNDGLTAINPRRQGKVDREIQKAEAEMVKADQEIFVGKPNKAIRHYGHAWKHVGHAVKEAAKE